MKLRKVEDDLRADPVFGESALISTLVYAEGIVCIDRHAEGLYEGETVEVIRI